MATDFIPPSPVSRSSLKRIVSGLGALWSGQAISILENLAIVPVYLLWWSANRYGEWLALSSLVSYFGTLDLGMNAAGSNKLTQEWARGKIDEYKRYQHSAIMFYAFVAAIGTALMALVVFLVPIASWLRLRETTPHEASLTAFILGLQVLWNLPVGFIAGIYRTTGDLARTEWVRNFQNVASVGFSALCLVLHGGMIAMALAQLACVLFAAVWVILDLRGRNPELAPGISAADLSLVTALIRPSAYFGVIMISEAIRVQGSVLLVSARLGGTGVALFVSCRTLCNAVRQIAGTVKTALWPHVTALEAKNRQSAVRQFHRLWVMTSTALCVSIAAALWFEGADVMRVWTRGRLPADVLLLRLLLVQLVFQAPWQASGLITIASNQHGKVSQAYFWSSTLALALAALLMNRMGIDAVPVGSIIAEAFICYHFVTRETCGRVGEAYAPFAIRQWTYVASAALATFGLAWAVHEVAAGPALVRWAEVGAASALAAAATLWLVGFRTSERSLVKSILQPAAA